MATQNQFLRFSLVGIAGFIVDAGVLTVLVDSLGPYVGRLISFGFAVVTTWLLNRQFTFENKRNKFSMAGEFARYLSAMIVGGVANYALYAALIYLMVTVQNWPILGVAAGSILGLGINFTLAKNWIFVKKN
ncbi:MAG: GtrA family protein [Devosiaceae bacterium]|nr:GtrA family protein [Devosiaceae bacterium]